MIDVWHEKSQCYGKMNCSCDRVLRIWTWRMTSGRSSTEKFISSETGTRWVSTVCVWPFSWTCAFVSLLITGTYKFISGTKCDCTSWMFYNAFLTERHPTLTVSLECFHMGSPLRNILWWLWVLNVSVINTNNWLLLLPSSSWLLLYCLHTLFAQICNVIKCPDCDQSVSIFISQECCKL